MSSHTCKPYIFVYRKAVINLDVSNFFAQALSSPNSWNMLPVCVRVGKTSSDITFLLIKILCEQLISLCEPYV